MTEPLLPPFKASPALQAGLYYARKNRLRRLAVQVANNIHYAASPPNPDVETGILPSTGKGDA